jgi:PIN domain nuclease of toxin-antitoxin system
MIMSKYAVLDASAVLALLGEESGSDIVIDAIRKGAVIGTVNLVEVITKLIDAGLPDHHACLVVESLGVEIVDLNVEHARAVALLRSTTKRYGLSIGDRSCLALALTLGIPVLTADKAWSELDLSIEVCVIR